MRASLKNTKYNQKVMYHYQVSLIMMFNETDDFDRHS